MKEPKQKQTIKIKLPRAEFLENYSGGIIVQMEANNMPPHIYEMKDKLAKALSEVLGFHEDVIIDRIYSAVENLTILAMFQDATLTNEPQETQQYS